MRRLFTAEESGLTRPTLRWGVRSGKWLRLEREVYLEGAEPPTEVDRARARVLAAQTVARGTLAGMLHGDARGEFVARVDLCWPLVGLFIELDGQHHPGQPVYDARRETALVAATGWLVGRFTWYEVVHVPRQTALRLAALVEQANRRPLAQTA